MKYIQKQNRYRGLIPEGANGVTTKTKTMRKAFLSYAQLREYLAMLLDNGLIEYEVDKLIGRQKKGYDCYRFTIK